MNILLVDKESDKCIVAVCPKCTGKDFKHIYLDLQDFDYLKCKHCGKFYSTEELINKSTY